eukprot:CAMPEP_0176227566 /NCGR_PEP_ID=MMETSP0121_2-20121125/22830_1 /TAXON_ID=160619 /ORGANISM="Kryptoperidinium foliaceum, Strain CCMP 1326" /LENGTH=309 /DNA_ID=CAMNT_0017566843 /DNA_START=1 /DNA_END=930 /DNA_ORIENTATION=+
MPPESPEKDGDALRLADVEAAIDEQASERTAEMPSEKSVAQLGFRGLLREVFASVKQAARQNRIGAAISFVVGVALVLSYNFGGAGARKGFNWLEKVQAEGGIPFSALATAVFGGFFPCVCQLALGKLPKPFYKHFIFQTALWAALGAAVNRLYFYQGELFGNGTDAVTVVKKVLFDQFVWNPFMATPVVAPCYRWKDHGFTLRECRKVFEPRAMALSYCSMLLSVWVTWIPGTAVVYMFPTALQVPSFNVILFMYAVLIALVSQNATRASQRLSSGSSGTERAVPAEDAPRRPSGRDAPKRPSGCGKE